jgi:signal transduction histidine kinase
MAQTQAGFDEDTDTLQRHFALFLRALTHQVNTPLAVLQAYLEILTPYLSGREAEIHLAVMRRELAGLISVFEDLGLRPALESGTLAVCPALLEVESLLPDLASAVEAQHPGRLVAFRYIGRLPPVLADLNHLRFILRTLLENAARYTPRRYRTIEMAIAVAECGQPYLLFRVRDGAPALLPAYGEMVFEPLPEMPPALRRLKFGLGLGLYAARELARRMGGDLWVERPRGRGQSAAGNVFVLRLPLTEAGGHE